MGHPKNAKESRAARGLCREPGCGKPAFKDSHRCRGHLIAHSAEQLELRTNRKDAGLCRCGKDSVLSGLKRCFLCTYGKRPEEVVDWVDEVIEPHLRSFVKGAKAKV
jgi:hypothetical protein